LPTNLPVIVVYSSTPKPITSTTIPTPVPTKTPIPAEWVEIKTGTTETINSIWFIDFNTGWAVGTKGTIRHTTNAGATWKAQNKGTNDLWGVCFIDANNGWVAGGNGVIFKTTDGGSSWTLLDSGGTGTIMDIKFINQNDGIFTNGGGIYHTNDGGQTWVKKSDYGGGSIFYRNDGKAWHSSGYKLVGGAWQQIPDFGFDGITFADNQKGYAWRGNFSKTTDGGNTWTILDKIVTDDEIIRNPSVDGVAFVNPSEGRMIGYSDYVTKNGGDTWTKVSDNTYRSSYITYFTLFNDVNHGWTFNSPTIYRLGY